MNFILIFTLCLSTYSIGASSHTATSVWDGWSVTELATFLQCNNPCVKCFSAALQYNYNSTHEDNIKEALGHLHRQLTEAVESCAEAFYNALRHLPIPNTQTTSTEYTALLPRQPLSALKERELFKNGMFHPDLARLIKKYAKTQPSCWNSRLDNSQQYFECIRFEKSNANNILHILLPLYIIDKNDHQLTQTHISTGDANVLIPQHSTLAFNADALRTAHTGAIFVYAKITVDSLLRLLGKKLSFIAYETKASPTSSLKAKPKDTEFSQRIEEECEYLLQLSKTTAPSPKGTPEQTPDLTRPEPLKDTLVDI